LSGTTRVSRYQKKHSPTHHPDHHPVFISFFHLPRSIASSLFKLHSWQSFCTTSLHVLFSLPLGLEPSTSYSIHFFTQSVSSFRSTCPYYCNLFCCSINIISSIPSLFLNSLLGTLSFTLTLHIRPFSSLLAEVPPHFLSWQARPHFHVHNTSHTTAVQPLSPNMTQMVLKSVKLQPASNRIT